MIVHDAQLEDQVAGVHTLASELEDHGFGGQLLAAAFRFDGSAFGSGHPVYWIYGFKTGTWWPFVPTGEKQERDNAQELELKAKLEPELPIEPDLSKWLACSALRSKGQSGSRGWSGERTLAQASGPVGKRRSLGQDFP